MNALETVASLNDAGLFVDALKALNELSSNSLSGSAREVLHAELLERVGRFSQARVILQTLIKRKNLDSGERSSCELVLGKIEWEEGLTESAIEHLQRSVQFSVRGRRSATALLAKHVAAQYHCPTGRGRTQLLIFWMTFGMTQPNLANHLSLAALHSYTGQMDAKQGLFASALWHVGRSQQILESAPNRWIEAQLEFTRTNIAVLSADRASALKHGHRAVELAEQSGSAACRRTTLGTLGFVFYSLGEFSEAVRCLERAIAVLPSPGESYSAMIDTLARIRLAQGRHRDCKVLLDRIEHEMQLPDDRLLYAHRHAALTRARLLASEGLFGALAQIDRTLILADEAKDQFLLHRGLLNKAQFLQQAGRGAESLVFMDAPVFELISQSPDLHAQYKTILACALAAAGQRDVAEAHRLRAERLYSSLRHAPGRLELSRCWDSAFKNAPTAEGLGSRPAPSAATALQAVSALMVQAGRPEFLAHELVSLLGETGCVRRAAALLIDAPCEPELLAATGVIGNPPYIPDTWPRRLVIGRLRGGSVELWLEPSDDIESIASVNAVALIISTVHEIERGRAEREQRLTLWPIDDMLVEDGCAVVNGRMRELMTHAKRIAKTKVTVLLTGESGTGKEVLARGVHGYSDRADKPFVPFNCAAIPREMLESQLFGHRRGAFTGADRDNVGVIRAARGGTLFLDEIGELSLELQPKLLRFLESGEICPLGESTPFVVDVRIIAATNANLESAVKGRRFREDLFYRLNVVCLPVPRSGSVGMKFLRSRTTSLLPWPPNTGRDVCGSPKQLWSSYFCFLGPATSGNSTTKSVGWSRSPILTQCLPPTRCQSKWPAHRLQFPKVNAA